MLKSVLAQTLARACELLAAPGAVKRRPRDGRWSDKLRQAHNRVDGTFCQGRESSATALPRHYMAA